MIYVTPGGQHIITTNVSSGTVDIIDKEAARLPPPPPGIAAPNELSVSRKEAARPDRPVPPLAWIGTR